MEIHHALIISAVVTLKTRWKKKRFMWLAIPGHSRGRNLKAGPLDIPYCITSGQGTHFPASEEQQEPREVLLASWLVS